MLASLALVPAAIGVLAPAGPDEGCPSPRQVADALGAHLPGMVLPLGQTIGPSALRLAVATDPTGVTRVDLFESGGDTLLHRTLSPGERARGSDCPALAETAALIVERYWHEVGYDLPPLQPPPPPPPPPSATEKPSIAESRPPPAAPPRAHPLWLLGLAAGGRAGDAGTFDPSALLAVTFEGPIGLRLSAGVGSGASAVTSLGTASFHQFPVRLGSYLRLPLGPGQLEPGLGVDLDAIWVGLTGMHPDDVGLTSPPLCTGQFCASPGADLALGWSMTTTHHVYFRALALAGGAASLRFTADNRVIWSTPRTYVEFAIECGAWIE